MKERTEERIVKGFVVYFGLAGMFGVFGVLYGVAGLVIGLP